MPCLSPHSSGAGNAVFPLLSANNNPLLELHAYDYSSHAVKLVQVSAYCAITYNTYYVTPYLTDQLTVFVSAGGVHTRGSLGLIVSCSTG